MRRILVFAAVLCALPASGDQVALPESVVVALTPLDTVPAKSDVERAFMPNPAVDSLIAIADDASADLGVALHAIRMLPVYCTDATTCAAGTPIHDTLFAIVNGYVTALGQAPLSPVDQLRLRAAIEALGATHSQLTGDADLLSASALLAHDSRDVRVTVVRALVTLASCQAVVPLERRSLDEPSPQVKLAIQDALQSLAPQCP